MANEVHDPLLGALRGALEGAGAEAAVLRIQIANILLQVQQFEPAFDACRDILVDEPGHIDALELAARACRGLGNDMRAARYDAARDTLKTAASALAAAEREPAMGDEGASITPLRVVPPGNSGGSTREQLSLADVAGMEAV